MTLCTACEMKEATTDCLASCECPLCEGCRAVLDETRSEAHAAYERTTTEAGDPYGAEIVGDFEYDSIRDEWRQTRGSTD
ncbi:hypothetical protein J2Y46_002565 [Microbacterium sp. BE35]|uniref:hypothetical protein n=1 Tax=Microbacterium sp. BE35 TaxID=2817773 RepID=UPI00285B6E4E|nr:hypothetical protein [Microbacterium sp. BE35]MDR7189739.1 hypothetical protein [Microbacterium sp. BE35]